MFVESNAKRPIFYFFSVFFVHRNRKTVRTAQYGKYVVESEYIEKTYCKRVFLVHAKREKMLEQMGYICLRRTKICQGKKLALSISFRNTENQDKHVAVKWRQKLAEALSLSRGAW